MKHSHRMIATAVSLLAAIPSFAAPVPSEKSPLAWVPAATPVVIHINGLHNLRDHVVAFLRKADPGDADAVQNGTEEFFRDGINGHKIRGVPKNGHILIALMDLNHINDNDNVPDLAVIVAVEDYKTFRDNLFNEEERKTLKSEDGYESILLDDLPFPGKRCFLVDKKDHAVFTLRKERAAEFAKGGPGLDGRISKSQSDHLLASDLGLYVSMDILHKDYAEMVKGAREALEEQLKRADEAADRPLKPLLGQARDAIGPLFQAVEDSQGILATIDLRADGLLLHADSEFRASGKTAELLKDFKPTAFSGLDKMPRGQTYYVGMETVAPLFRLTGTMLFSSVADAKGQEAKAIDEAVQEMLQAGPRERLLAVSAPPSGVEAWRFDDPDKAVAAQARLIAATGAALVKAGVLKDQPEIQPHAHKVKGFDFTAVRVRWDVDKMLSPAAGASQQEKDRLAAAKKALGDGMNLWFGTDGKAFVQVTAPDWDAAQKQLDGYLQGADRIGGDKAFTAARKALPAEATALMVIDVVRQAETLGGAAPRGPIPADLQGKPGYVGVAATLEPGRAGLDLYVQAEVVRMVRGGWPLFGW